jgi:hypothetical protein
MLSYQWIAIVVHKHFDSQKFRIYVQDILDILIIGMISYFKIDIMMIKIRH